MEELETYATVEYQGDQVQDAPKQRVEDLTGRRQQNCASSGGGGTAWTVGRELASFAFGFARAFGVPQQP